MIAAMRLYLASASARRRELLAAAGIAFLVDPVDVNEYRWESEPAEAYVTRVALAKAERGRTRHPADAVLGADTIVLVDGDVLGKPATDADAVAMLARLSGRDHEVLTAASLLWPGGSQSILERTRVWFTALTPDDIRRYVATGESRDKAGAYAIQGLASRFVPRIDGSYSNVVGLPLHAVWQLLRSAGLDHAPAVS